VTRPRRRARRRPWLAAALLLPLGLGVLAAAGGLLYLQEQGIAPRALAPYIDKRSSGHNPLITGAGHWVAEALQGLDSGDRNANAAALPRLGVGAQPGGVASDGRTAAPKLVASAAEARAALAAATPGEAIVFLPGVYRVDGELVAGRPGASDAPIVVRAERPGTVTIEFDAVEGFKVLAPYWRFENLTIHGVCKRQEECEHAFHVVGGAHHFVARNNTILDFNAHFKINGEQGRFPDAGLIEGNTLSNSAPRSGDAPVTPIDLVAASDWIVRRNLITDFIKTGGDQVSYGAFAKGAGARTLFEQNVVLCEQRLRGLAGQRVGLSFGGGGTGKAFCRDGKCITEQDRGTMRANLVASCSDAGIYVNASAGSRLADNTVIDTAGVQLRFPETSAELDGNLVDGAILSRNGARMHLGDNLQTPVALLYLGYHPLRRLFVAPDSADFNWRGEPPVHTAAASPADLCGTARARTHRYGAFDDFTACLAPGR
jgi:parallel beta-helix repeat protein